ncbi:MAG: hypothetical protein A2W03_08680 [Candidatus Aminicenantes bacterium RBG_16_63_16]|nr:MAG: hypothetical protein A2W03_08680 [Candidatus Aminicenantes bacterium RBG_16_63_16]
MRSQRLTALAIIGLGLALGRAVAGHRELSFRLDAAALEARGQLNQLRRLPDKSGLRLNDLVLVEDDAVAIGRPKGATDRSWFEELRRGVRIKKVLVLDDPRAFSGFLVFNGLEAVGNKEPLHISLNGVHFLRPASQYAHPFAREYFTREWTSYADFDNWFRVAIPVGALKKGANEVLLWADSEAMSWEIMVAADEEYARGSDTRHHHPNRSAKSADGGASWSYEKLGRRDLHDGEYAVRLSLDRYAPAGVFVSPVIDIGVEPGKDGLKKLIRVEDAAVAFDLDLPDGTAIEISTRWGANAVPSSSGWSEFERFDGRAAAFRTPRGRFMQFRAVLKTANPLATPSLNGVAVTTRFSEEPPAPAVFCKLLEFKNGSVIRPSVEFRHEDFLKLAHWREKFALDAEVAGAATEFEKQLLLMRWAYEIPIQGLDPYHWSYDDLPILKKDAKGNIVKDVEFQEKGRRRGGHCLYSNLTLIGACLALGFPARWVNIATMSTYGHEVAEVWSNDFNKWVFMDATRDYYIYDPDTGIPMSLIEINDRLKDIFPRPVTWENPLKFMIPDETEANRVRIAYREGNNKFSVKDIKHGPQLLLYKGHLSQVLRNDFASRPTPVPWRLSSNWGGDLFYGYFADKFPRKREYALHTERWQDFNPPLNQAELTLAETATAGVLRVDADTETPCFETFLASLDGGEWRATPGPSFPWTLHEGLNSLRVRVRNTAGVTGPVSQASVVFNR